MEPRNWIGLTIIIVGLILQPVGWMYVFWIQGLSFVLIAIGVLVFATQKILERKIEKEYGSGGSGKPGEIHGYSGWGDGGRSESWKAEHGGDGGSGD